ncbi:MAG: SURF1 family protein [Pseudomonadota bacterium]
MSEDRTSTRGRFWVITAAALIGIAVTTALGFWQLGRANEKLSLQAAIDGRRAMAPLTAQALVQPLAEIVHRPIVLRGTWLPDLTVFLDNRQMQGKPGFYVLTPLKLEGSARAVLVERGWAQRNFMDRTQLPPVETPAGIVEVRGRVAPPPAKLYELGAAPGGAIRQNLDLALFRSETGLDLPDLTVQQLGEASEGLLRNWPQPATGVEKHYGYLFQWWALALVIAILYAWFQFIAPRRRQRRVGQSHHA